MMTRRSIRNSVRYCDPDWLFWWLAGILVVSLIALGMLAVAGMGKAEAHSWYTGLTNPVTGVGCCGGTDCAPFPDDWVTPTSGGYLLSWPEGETELIPYNEVLPSADEHYHRCKYLSGPNKDDRRCFMAPPQGF